ncbi:MAG: hypothetical protein ACE5JA_02580, partial [bacterium]
VILHALREPRLIYPIVTLGLCAYYLMLSAAGTPALLFPSLFLLPLLIIWIFGAVVVRSLESRRTLFSAAHLASIFFLAVLALLAIRGALTRPVFVGLPLLGISFFCLERYLCGRRTLAGYFGFILFYTGIVFLLLSIPKLPVGYVGVPLLVVTAGAMAAGTMLQGRLGFAKLTPVYLTGIASSIAALIISSVSGDAFFITGLGFSFHLFGFSKTLALKPTASRLWEMTTYKASFGLANLAAAVVGVFLVVDKFPFRILPMIACAGYVYFYSTLGLKRKRTLLRMRSLYVYAAAFFSLSVYFTALVYFVPNILYSTLGFSGAALLVGVLLLAGLKAERTPVLAKSVYDTGYAVVAVSFLVPAALGAYSHLASALLGCAFAATYLIFWAKTRETLLCFQLVPVFLFMYLSTASLLGLGLQWLSVALVVPGLVFLVLALTSRESGSIRHRLYYTAFFLSSLFSLTLSVYVRWLDLYLVAVWGILYLISGSIWQRRVSYA